MRPLLLLLSSILLTACSTFQPPVAENHGMLLGHHFLTWPARQTQLSNIKNFEAQGNLGAHSNTQGWNASFALQHQGTSYQLQLFGPLGIDRVVLQGQPGYVSLTNTKGQTLTANSPEILLARETGWQLPVSSLYYWLRGLPNPTDTHYRRSLDMNNHIAQLTQQGWHIIYLRYIDVNGIDLPERMLLSNANWQVRLVILHWQLDS